MPRLRPYPELSSEAEAYLNLRAGRLHLWQRRGIQRDHVTRIFGRGRNFFHIENWYSVHTLMRLTLRALWLYERGRRNATAIVLKNNEVRLSRLPRTFDGWRLLHLSDIHLDMDPAIFRALSERVAEAEYDLCVITGDFRARTYGEESRTLHAMAKLRERIRTPIYAVLGNHDFIEMVPALESLDLRVLLNESVKIEHGADALFLAGVDDPHYYRADNLEKAADGIPAEAPAILLSHSPEIYRHAAHAGFDLMLCGHTHGGQICLPGGLALTYNAKCPRALGRGAWRWGRMQGYTSRGAGSCVIPVRFNCPPEITIHQLRRG
ncbi:putative phosphohydrolase [Thioflavicoccus mobilis 8321]|uniref:Putative phosphohydrolase n=1 Tax=Thioflavicoccus mobilis 8321 TaxID=765912 RepID=L0GW52_9GAMM|nr:metallophosphoesterase [Thioflavicoccus mobilis]AGA90057.1 putative phosphohydrolase [Thioflavicoccus mobilis 8321]